MDEKDISLHSFTSGTQTEHYHLFMKSTCSKELSQLLNFGLQIKKLSSLRYPIYLNKLERVTIVFISNQCIIRYITLKRYS